MLTNTGATQYCNRVEGRSGTLWEGRYKSSPVQTETYLLACTRYIELNPVRARMVPVAGDYAWSSYRQRIGEEDRWIDLDPAYLDLADNESDRRARYARFVEQAIPEHELSLMREALQRGRLTDNQRGRSGENHRLSPRTPPSWPPNVSTAVRK